MPVVHEARCPYCGETWEIDVGVEQASDEEFLEATRTPYVYVPCERCTYLHFD
ncbi:hypothetical protein [Alicyclobacillus macrosporangiidus]|uniref:hypothetical protein n=1 Tax=Alicyclobacillus macrosporangiidus TaxID=392015 RepID=UPI000A6A8B08|nr:hypothetical protein [Alicyclobacillus macrosporangiidus]